jgi:hypothetical protein
MLAILFSHWVQLWNSRLMCLYLGDAINVGPNDDPRKVIVLALAMEVAGRGDVVLDLSSAGTKVTWDYFPFMSP